MWENAKRDYVYKRSCRLYIYIIKKFDKAPDIINVGTGRIFSK